MSISSAPPQLYPAPSPHGDLESTGFRGWVARRPLTGFLVIVLGLSWLLFSIPVLAFHGIIPGANLPVEVFALGSTLLILLPMALWVTAITDGRAGLRALLALVFRWRFGIGWWLVVLFGLPVIALLLGLIFGGSLHTADLGPVLIKQLGSIVLAVVVIDLWEETRSGLVHRHKLYRLLSLAFLRRAATSGIDHLERRSCQLGVRPCLLVRSRPTAVAKRSSSGVLTTRTDMP